MKILLIGDIFAKPGRKTVAEILPKLKSDEAIDLVIANVENLHHGKGVSDSKAQELLNCGVDFMTGGNHIWKIQDIYEHMNKTEYPLIRPANYPKEAPGSGMKLIRLKERKSQVVWADRVGGDLSKDLFEDKKSKLILVINLMGRVFMPGQVDDPLRTADRLIQEANELGLELGKNLQAIIVDMHAETTSEKLALAYYLDGRVSAVYGTHTHVPTADQRVLPKGTAYQSDVGMTGVLNSMIGLQKEGIIQGMLTQMPTKHEVEEMGETYFNALRVDIDDQTGLAVKVERIQKFLN
ncbi:YmdB family metallophosphoesterase [Candidatus Peregrinibacteria bacterium]|nr:YmdB family metallophosphoesterase [Candidatus Peregrinibacteria bacterium]